MIKPERVIFQGNTKHDYYAVVERQYEGRPSRVLFSGARRAAQSGIGLDDDPDLLFDYNQRLLELANALYPKRILVIGGGAFTLPMALVTALPDATVDVVELDEGLEAISRDYFGLQTSDRLKLHFEDGRQFIAHAKSASYDLVIIDVYTELSIPKQFLTIEFVELVANTLTPNGSVAFNVIASYQGKNTALIRSQLAAYQQYFTSVDIFPAAHGLTNWLPQNLMLVAQKTPMDGLKDYIRFAPLDTTAIDPVYIITDASLQQPAT